MNVNVGVNVVEIGIDWDWDCGETCDIQPLRVVPQQEKMQMIHGFGGPRIVADSDSTTLPLRLIYQGSSDELEPHCLRNWLCLPFAHPLGSWTNQSLGGFGCLWWCCDGLGTATSSPRRAGERKGFEFRGKYLYLPAEDQTCRMGIEDSAPSIPIST